MPLADVLAIVTAGSAPQFFRQHTWPTDRCPRDAWSEYDGTGLRVQLQAQIWDACGSHAVDWRSRALAAEAEVERLKSHNAPRWDGRDYLWGCVAYDVACIRQDGDQWVYWGQPVIGRLGFRGHAPTEAEARARVEALCAEAMRAEKACGVEVGNGDL